MRHRSFLRNATALLTYLLTVPASAAAAQDSAFHLATADPARHPSPFIGNGRIGVVIPALGFGASESFLAGVYEHAPGDVPRIAAVPAWTAVAVSDGEAWLDTTAIVAGALRDYRQVLDMRTGTVRTRYAWVRGARRTGIAVETFVSRADSNLAGLRLDLTPQQRGRVRVRFALEGRPPPRRLPLATLARADPSWRPPDIWYPGHMAVRSRTAGRSGRGARLSLTSTPAGRTLLLGQAATVVWPAALPRPAVQTRAAGDTAMVEIAFDAEAGRTYSFTQTTAFAAGGKDPRALAGR